MLAYIIEYDELTETSGGAVLSVGDWLVVAATLVSTDLDAGPPRQVDQDNYQLLYDEEDVHVLTSTLKLFFRELKEPLVPFAVLPEALRVAGLSVRADQVTGFRRMVAALPPPNRDTLAALLGHLSR